MIVCTCVIPNSGKGDILLTVNEKGLSLTGDKGMRFNLNFSGILKAASSGKELSIYIGVEPMQTGFICYEMLDEFEASCVSEVINDCIAKGAK